MTKPNVADKFAAEAILYAGLPVTRLTAYRLDQAIGNSADCSDFMAFGPCAKRVTDEPFAFEQAQSFLYNQEANCVWSGK